MLEWDDHEAAEQQRYDEEAGGNVWLLNVDTGDIQRVDGNYLIGVGPGEGYREIRDVTKMELVALLRKHYEEREL